MDSGVFNPDIKDFSVQFDVTGDRKPVLFTVPGREIAYFPKGVANKIKSDLADHLLHKRGTSQGGVSRPPSEVKKEIIQEISV
jgi:hypothetical protein